MVERKILVYFYTFEFERLSKTVSGGLPKTFRDNLDVRQGCTIGFSALSSDGVRGFVTTGHIAFWAGNRWVDRVAPVGTEVHQQPTYVWWWPGLNFIGRIFINPPSPVLVPRFSDASFVTVNPGVNVVSTIEPNRVITRWVSELFAPHGLLIQIHGATIGYRYSVIMGFGYHINCDFFPLLNQILVSVQPSTTHQINEGGDSGGPIFISDPDSSMVAILGVLVGRVKENPSKSVYSSIDAIQRKLNLRWGTP